MKSSKKPLLILMLIKWGALVVDGRGKLGGHVAAQNRGGSYLRTKVTPSNPQTTAQTGIRNLFGAISQGWSSLTQDQITAWNQAVEDWKSTNIFGDLRIPSGKALYQRLNTQAQQVGYNLMSLPPPKALIPNSNVTALSVKVAGHLITPTGIYSGTAATVQVFSSGPVSKGTTYVKNLMRQIYHSGGAAYVAADAGQGYENKFGTMVSGDKVFVGFKIVTPNGQSSPMQIVETEIVA